MVAKGHLLTAVGLALTLVICEVTGHFHFHGSHKKNFGGKRRAKRQAACDPTYKYRSYDGTCHNTNIPEAGATYRIFKRLLNPVYGNGVNTPRNRSVDGTALPNPRTISVLVHDPDPARLDNNVNHMTMQWGQFLDHDITLTPTGTPTSACCYDSLVTNGERHPDMDNGGYCDPIIIPAGDAYFTTTSSRCMYFERSAHEDDEHGVRQQYNIQTAWIDGSQIYGTDSEQADSLRAHAGGRMDVKVINNEEFLPEDVSADGDSCFKREGTDDYCFLAGDARVMVYPGLNAMHTIFVRYHNLIAGRLQAIHSDWGDEALYQEARRIVVAALQKISYDEYLDAVLGSDNTASGIDSSAPYAYDSSIDATLPNVFSTAAFRFAHSNVGDGLNIGNTRYETGVLFNRPAFVLDSLQDTLEAILEEPVQRTDRWYAEDMTNKMFEKPDDPMSGFDIAARNIKRGRDHGLPGYNDWREYCNLARNEMDELDGSQGTAGRFRQAGYRSADDIDLYTGGVTERPDGGLQVGPLYVCLLTKTFEDLKFGDRFWYQNTGDATSFTDGQISEIDRLRLSKIFCDTVPGIVSIQRNVFRAVSDRNPLVSCTDLQDIRIDREWTDETVPVTSAPVTSAPVTEAPVTEAPVTQPPATEAPVTEAPVTQPPVTNAPATQAPPTNNNNNNNNNSGRNRNRNRNRG